MPGEYMTERLGVEIPILSYNSKLETDQAGIKLEAHPESQVYQSHAYLLC